MTYEYDKLTDTVTDGLDANANVNSWRVEPLLYVNMECFVDGKKVRENIRNSGCYKPNAQNPWKMLLGKMPDCAKQENVSSTEL